MKSAYQSIYLCFKAVYSNVLVFHVYCDAAKQPTLKDVKLLVRIYDYIKLCIITVLILA